MKIVRDSPKKVNDFLHKPLQVRKNCVKIAVDRKKAMNRLSDAGAQLQRGRGAENRLLRVLQAFPWEPRPEFQ